MADVADQIGPGDAVGAFDEPGMGDGPEGFADVGRVGDIAVGAEEDGADAGCVGGVAEVGVCGFFRTGLLGQCGRIGGGEWDTGRRAVML